MKSKEIIRKATNNMKNKKSEKYSLEPDVIEKKSLRPDVFRIKFDFHRLDKVKIDVDRRVRHAQKIDKRKKLTEKLEIGHTVSVLAERLNKKDAPGKFYKSATQTKSFLIRSKYLKSGKKN